MENLVINLLIGIISGIIGGIISSIIIYFYSEKRIKVRKIIEYAERTAEKAEHVYEEALECSKGKDITLLKQLINKQVRRNFAGEIVENNKLSEQLQNAIAACNAGIYKIEKATETENSRTALFHAVGDLNDALLDILNAATEYDVDEDRRIEKHKKVFIRGTVCILIIVIILIIIIA